MTTPELDNLPPNIEHELRALTTWPERAEKTELWQAALDSAAKPAPSSFLARPKTLRLITTLSAAAILLLAVGSLLVPMFGKARSPALSVGHIAFEGGAQTPPPAHENDSVLDAVRDSVADRLDPAGVLQIETKYKDGFAERGRTDAPARLTMGAPADDTATRSVIRKATIELAVPDARETFAKVQHLLRADLGEFVEGSNLTGESEPGSASPGRASHAQLTLRVAATRMDEVLNQLRTLGKIDSENATGDDVSAQVVDLDARLRNEKSVETEILRLLESRKDAQLKDILELRDKLSSIRQSIELLQGRRDNLGRQIALASILVIIRPDKAPKETPKPASLIDGFSTEVSNAWTSGLSVLTQTIAFLIRIAVGGLIWWLLLFAAIAIARRAIRRLIPDPAAVPVSA